MYLHIIFTSLYVFTNRLADELKFSAGFLKKIFEKNAQKYSIFSLY